MPQDTESQQRPLARQVYSSLCPMCRIRISDLRTNRFINALRPRRPWAGRYVTIYQLEMFFQIVRSEVNLNSDRVSMEQLNEIARRVSQMRQNNNDCMDVDCTEVNSEQSPAPQNAAHQIAGAPGPVA